MDEELIDQILKEDIPEWDFDEFPVSKDISNSNINGENGSVITDADDDGNSSRMNDESVQESILAGSSVGGTPVVSPECQRRAVGTVGRRHKTGRVIKHSVLTKVVNQMSYGRSGNTNGSMTCCARGRMLAVGTSRGLTFLFDLKQVLRFYVGGPDKGGEQHGAVSSLSFNMDSSRLLVAFAKAHINMWDVSGSEGKLLRSIDVNQGPGYAVSFVRFLPDPTMAVYADTNGSVFQMSFRRGLAGRSTDLECFFSGCRGEILCLEPLLVPRGRRGPQGGLEEHQLLAMASFTKVVLVAARPCLKVRYMAALHGRPDTMPHLAWSLRCGGADHHHDNDDDKHRGAVYLTFARDALVQVLRVSAAVPRRPGIDLVTAEARSSELRFEVVFRLELDRLQILSVKWLNEFILAVLDFEEQIHAVDVRTRATVEVLDLRSVQLVYNRSLFRSTATGGHVSEAMAAAAERACYHSVVEQGGQVKLLGAQGIHLLSLRPWAEAVQVAMDTQGPEAAFLMCSALHDGDSATSRQVLQLPRAEDERRRAVSRFSAGLMESALHRARAPGIDLHAFFSGMLGLCVATRQLEFYTGTVFGQLRRGSAEEEALVRSVVPLVLGGAVRELPPELVQRLTESLLAGGQAAQLDGVLARLAISCIDLDQVVRLAERHHLFSALIHLYNGAFRDYLGPARLLVAFIGDAGFAGLDHEIQSEAVIRAIVYVHCCLGGKDHFTGEPLPPDICDDVKANMFEYLVPFASTSRLTPLDLLLQCNANELLNMLTLAFDGDLFTSDVGASRKQATVQCLCKYFLCDSNDTSKEDTIRFFLFLSRELTKAANVSIYIDQSVLDEVFEKVCLGLDDLQHGGGGGGSTSGHAFLKKQTEAAFTTFLRSESHYRQHWLASDLVLSLARRSRLYQICECIYRHRGLLHLVLECFLLDRDCSHSAFELLEAAWLDDAVDDGLRAQMLAKCVELCEELVLANHGLAVVVLLVVAGKRLEEVLERLPPDGLSTRFLFLKAFFAIRGEVPDSEGACGRSSAVAPAVALQVRAVKVHAPVAELFVDLLCRCEPDSLPVFLRYSIDYRPEAAAALVAKHDLPYPLGFLYEKMRRYDDACDIYTKVFDKVWAQSLSGGGLSNDSSFISSSVGRDFQLCINRFVSLIKKYKVHSEDVERLWLQMLDRILDKKTSSKERQYDFTIKAIFTYFVKSLSTAVPMPAVLVAVLRSPAFVGEDLGHIRDLIIFMMNSFHYEKLLLESCIAMVNDDVADCITQLRTVLGNGVVVTDLRCCLCSELVASRGAVLTFRCGHRFHQRCLTASKTHCADQRVPGGQELRCGLCARGPVPGGAPGAGASGRSDTDTAVTPPPPSTLARHILAPDADRHSQPVTLRLSPPNYLINFCK